MPKLPQPERIPRTGEPAVLHVAFRKFWTRRTAINQAINALTFSERLAEHEILLLRSHLLGRLISEVYPSKVAVAGFNYTLGGAADQLRASSDFLAEAAFVLCQPAYETYLAALTELLSAALGRPLAANDKRSMPARHHWLANQGIDITSSDQFRLAECLREARNALIHEDGTLSSRAENARAAVPHEGEQKWRRATRVSLPAMKAGQRLPPGSLPPVGMIYAIANLAIEVNRATVASGTVSATRWADVAVMDFRLAHPGRWRGLQFRQDVLQSLRRHVNFNFGAALPRLLAGNGLAAALNRAPANCTLP